MYARITLVVACLVFAQAAWAAGLSPANSFVTVTYSQVFTGSYRTGQPMDLITILPDGSGESWTGSGITIRVTLRDAQGNPCAGIPASDITLRGAGFNWCPGGNIAAAPTNAQGVTLFVASIKGGGCAMALEVWAQNQFIATIPAGIISPDGGASPGFVDAADIAAFAVAMSGSYSICFDYNKSGQVDASDLAYFAASLGKHC